MQKTIDKDMIMEIFKRAAYCRSKDGTREHLEGIFVTPLEDKMRVVATDGHRMAVWNNTYTEEESAVIQGPILDFIWAQRDNVKEVSIEAHGKKQQPTHVVLTNGTATFDLEPHSFPPHTQVIPATYDGLVLGRTPVVKRSLIELKKAKFAEVYLSTDQGRLYLGGAHATKRESKVLYKVRTEIGVLNKSKYNDPLRLGIKLEYLLECIRSLRHDTFTIKLLGPLDPLVIETEDSTHVIMPMRI